MALAAQSPIPQQSQAQAAQAALTGGAGASSGSIQALQRSVGNRTTTAVVRREVDVEEGLEKTSGTTDTLSAPMNVFSGLGGLEKQQIPNTTQSTEMYKMGNTNSAGAGVGASSSMLSGLASGVSMGLSSKSAINAQKKKAELLDGKTGGARDTAKKEANYRDANRTHKTSGTNAVQSAGNVVGSGMSATSGVSQILNNAGSTSAFAGANNLLGGIAGCIALPIQVIATIRNSRKAAKQYKRWQALAKIWVDPKAKSEDLAKRVNELDQILQAQEATIADLKSDKAMFERALQRIDDRATQKKPDQRDAADRPLMEQKVADTDAAILVAEQKRDEFKDSKEKAEETRREAARTVAEAGQRKENGEETPEDIRAYAMQKNESGFFKKIVNVVGGLLGIGGGIAATVASFAAIGATAVVGTAAMATPVGWALCGAAALIGLAMGGIALVKWAKKRYETLRKTPPGGQQMSKTKAFFGAINPFKKVPGGEREHMAERLYSFATGTAPGMKKPDDQDHAKQTLEALGLEPDELNLGDPSQKAAAIKLIKEKMAS